jgi:hypothetical protein
MDNKAIQLHIFEIMIRENRFIGFQAHHDLKIIINFSLFF